MTKKRVIELFRLFPEVNGITYDIPKKKPFPKWMGNSYTNKCTYVDIIVNKQNCTVWCHKV